MGVRVRATELHEARQLAGNSKGQTDEAKDMPSAAIPAPSRGNSDRFLMPREYETRFSLTVQFI